MPGVISCYGTVKSLSVSSLASPSPLHQCALARKAWKPAWQSAKYL